MSGSDAGSSGATRGSGGGGTGGGQGGSGGPNCADIFERTTLASPVPGVLQELQPSQRLLLNLEAARGPLMAVTEQGTAAGSITSPSLARIINCINNGFQFVAIVIAVRGGKCDVEVRPAGS